MDKDTKSKLLQMLHENDLFKESMKTVQTEEERRKIQAFAEDFCINFVSGLIKLKKTVEENPDKVAEVMKNKIPKI